MASHLVEIAKDKNLNNDIKCLCFDATVKDNIPNFSYKLKRGVSDIRLGLVILRKENVFSLLDIE